MLQGRNAVLEDTSSESWAAKNAFLGVSEARAPCKPRIPHSTTAGLIPASRVARLVPRLPTTPCSHLLCPQGAFGPLMSLEQQVATPRRGLAYLCRLRKAVEGPFGGCGDRGSERSEALPRPGPVVTIVCVLPSLCPVQSWPSLRTAQALGRKGESPQRPRRPPAGRPAVSTFSHRDRIFS